MSQHKRGKPGGIEELRLKIRDSLRHEVDGNPNRERLGSMSDTETRLREALEEARRDIQYLREWVATAEPKDLPATKMKVNIRAENAIIRIAEALSPGEK